MLHNYCSSNSNCCCPVGFPLPSLSISPLAVAVSYRILAASQNFWTERVSFSPTFRYIFSSYTPTSISVERKKFDTIQLLCVAVFILVLAVFFFCEIASFSSLFILFRSFSDCQFRGGREKIPLFSRSPSSVLYHRSVDDDNDDDDVLALMEMFIVIAFGIVVLWYVGWYWNSMLQQMCRWLFKVGEKFGFIQLRDIS